jgi:hypothetical protein
MPVFSPEMTVKEHGSHHLSGCKTHSKFFRRQTKSASEHGNFISVGAIEYRSDLSLYKALKYDR